MLDAYGARRAAEVMDDTWGHLKPKTATTYEGWILYCVGGYGDVVSIASDFAGLASSPWLYEDLHDFLGDNGEERGFIYIWEGTYCRARGSKFMGQFGKRDAGLAKQELFKRD